MKKSLLLLFYFIQISPSLSSGFNLTNDIVFKGSVVNTIPQWEWNFDSDISNLFSNINTNYLSVEEKDNIRVFSYNDPGVSNITFINGVTTTPISFGSAGLIPVLSIVDMYGKSILLNNDLESEIIKVPVLGRSKSGQEINGILSFSIFSGKAIAYQRFNSDDWYFESNSNNLGSTALSMIFNQLGNGQNSSSINALKHDSSYNAFNFSENAKKDIKSFMGAYASYIDNVQTIWGTTPQSWRSSITIQVSYK